MQERKLEKKVITLLLESSKTFFLSVQYAYSLEDAFVMAKMEFEKMNPRSRGGNSLDGAKIGLFSVKTMDEFVAETELPTINNSIQTLENGVGQIKIGALEGEDLVDMLEQVAKPIRRFGHNPFKKPEPAPKIEVIAPELVTQTPEQKKKEIMEQIIKTKDRRILEMNKDLFTPYEIMYLEDKIK